MNKQDELLLHYEKLIRKSRCMDKTEKPVSCKSCIYYRPEFKYRSCFYARCPFGEDQQVFRKKPLRRDKFSGKEVVKMRV